MPRQINVDSQEFIKIWTDGMAKREMAKHFDVSEKTITNLARELQLPKRAAGRRTDIQNEVELKGGQWVKQGRIMVYKTKETK